MIVRPVALTAWIIAAGCGTPTDDRRSDTTRSTPTLGSAPIDWRRGATCYEIFVRSYYDSNGDGIGDLKGLTQKLDYINDGNPSTDRDLGAKCIWLMPVAESPSYHGYDASDYYRVDPDYGTNADFKAFAAAAHQRGIAVIVDMVLNHLSNEHPYFQDALGSVNGAHRAWFRFASPKPAETGPWGQEAWHKSALRDEYYYGVFWHGMPDLNYETPAVRQEAKRIASFWLTEMGVDGFRLDAVPYLVEEGRNQIGTAGTHAFLREYAAHIRSVAPNAFTVGEVWDGIDKMLPYYPDQLETYFAFDLSDSLVAAARTGSAAPLMRRFVRFQREVPNGRYSTFVRNHDQTRTVTALTPGAASATDAVARAKVAATLLLTLPGMPFVYYGEEIGMTGDKPDELLRTPMQWSASANAGFTTGRPWQALAANWQTTNVTAQDTDAASLLALHRKLINLRARTSALAAGDFVPLTTSSGAVAAYLRRDGQNVALVVVNLGGSAATSITLTSADSVLAAGTYRVASLIGGPAGAALTVASDGRVRDYAPLGSLGPREGYVFELAR
jgi:alpha-amylase